MPGGPEGGDIQDYGRACEGEVGLHDESVADRLFEAGLDALGVTDEAFPDMKMSSPAKYAVAWLARQNTSIPN